MKGYRGIYLLMATLAATCISGCARDDVVETEPFINTRSHLVFGPGDSQFPPSAAILSIYKADQPTKAFTPSPTAHDLWLTPGSYVAKIGSCEQSPNGDAPEKWWTQLGPDRLFKFSINGNLLKHLACANHPDGTTYVWIEFVLPPGALG